MTAAWRVLADGAIETLPGQLGVYQIGSADGTVLYIGMAGGRSLFGLRGELARERERVRASLHAQFAARLADIPTAAPRLRASASCPAQTTLKASTTRSA